LENMTALKKGFTLIELLIVIAILGVLAVVVLVAINPVQQLARTRDAGRMSSVAQLGHAVEAYYTSHNGTYPAALADLETSGEINQVPDSVPNTLTTEECVGTNGWCYTSAVGTGFVVWSRLEADTNIPAGGANPGYAVYTSESGRSCITASALNPGDACP